LQFAEEMAVRAALFVLEDEAGGPSHSDFLRQRLGDFDLAAVVLFRVPVEVGLALDLDDVVVAEVFVFGVRHLSLPEPRAQREVQEEPLLGVGPGVERVQFPGAVGFDLLLFVLRIFVLGQQPGLVDRLQEDREVPELVRVRPLGGARRLRAVGFAPRRRDGAACVTRVGARAPALAGSASAGRRDERA
jgi:hypothetical protein